MKWQNQRVNFKMHRYRLNIQIDQFFKIPQGNEYVDVWCELGTEKGFLRSDLVNINNT